MNWIEVNGTSLRYEVTGGGSSTLVLIHEMGGTLDSWDQVLPALNNGRRVLRYDTRGAGLSEKIKGSVTWDQMAGDVVGLLEALGITGKVSLAGIAVGGAIAAHFAVRNPDRAAALVLHGPAPGVDADRRQATLDRAATVEPAWPIPTRLSCATTPKHSPRSGRAGSVTTRKASPPSIACWPPRASSTNWPGSPVPH
jgi:3-oxoadipate enol-lactonase